MAKILIVPICGNCGYDLSKNECSIETRFISDYFELPNGTMVNRIVPVISPCVCPKCGTLFTDIAIYPNMPRQNIEEKIVFER